MIVPRCLYITPSPSSAFLRVYLSASKQTFDTELYYRVLAYIQQGFPTADLLDPVTLWASPADWRTTYQHVLYDATHLFILPNGRGYVGRGSYTEWEFLASRVSFCGAFVYDDGLWTPITLILADPHNWVDHVIIHHLPTGRLSAPDSAGEPGHGT